MPKLYPKEVILIFLLLSAFSYPNLVADEQTDKTIVATEHLENAQANETLPAYHKQEAPTQGKTDEGFEKVPKKVVYGPFGIVLQILEYTLDKLYVLFEY